MKRTFIAMMLAVTSLPAFSQEPAKTLFTTPSINQIGIYVSPEIQYGQLKSGYTTFGGGSVMFLFNQKFAAGMSFQRSMERDYSPSGISPLYLHAGYGGFKMEYTIHPESPVHITIPLMIGMGFASADSGYVFNRDRGDSVMRHMGDMNNYLIIQPGIQLEANLIKYTKLYVGASYRFAYSRENNPVISSTAMEGLSVYAGLKIGLFDYNIPRKKAN